MAAAVKGQNPEPEIPAEDLNEKCPVCKTDRYLNRNMKLLVSPCYHKMCESCVNRLFSAGAAQCPMCKTTLRKTNFVVPIFTDLVVEKEVRIRKRILKMQAFDHFDISSFRFNKRPEDFDDKRSYDDYLEEIEDIIFNLVNDVDVQGINARIEQYQQENASIIQANLAKNQDELQAIKDLMDEEKQLYFKRREVDFRNEQDELNEKTKRKQMIMHQLAASNKEASDIISEIKTEDNTNNSLLPNRGALDKKPGLSDRIKALAAMKKKKEAFDAETLAFYDPLSMHYKPKVDVQLRPPYYDPFASTLATEKLKAAGYSITFLYRRAIEMAKSDLFVQPIK